MTTPPRYYEDIAGRTRALNEELYGRSLSSSDLYMELENERQELENSSKKNKKFTSCEDDCDDEFHIHNDDEDAARQHEESEKRAELERMKQRVRLWESQKTTAAGVFVPMNKNRHVFRCLQIDFLKKWIPIGLVVMMMIGGWVVVPGMIVMIAVGVAVGVIIVGFH